MSEVEDEGVSEGLIAIVVSLIRSQSLEEFLVDCIGLGEILSDFCA